MLLSQINCKFLIFNLGSKLSFFAGLVKKRESCKKSLNKQSYPIKSVKKVQTTWIPSRETRTTFKITFQQLLYEFS